MASIYHSCWFLWEVLHLLGSIIKQLRYSELFVLNIGVSRVPLYKIFVVLLLHMKFAFLLTSEEENIRKENPSLKSILSVN